MAQSGPINCARFTYIFFFVLWQQLVDSVSKQSHVAFGILTDALN